MRSFGRFWTKKKTKNVLHVCVKIANHRVENNSFFWGGGGNVTLKTQVFFGGRSQFIEI